LAGLVSRIRYHQTKTGKEMAFVGIEDTQGIIDLVIFPRTWRQVSDMIEYDKVVIVEGRVDAKNGEPKILVDSVKTEIDLVTPFEAGKPRKKSPPPVPQPESPEEKPPQPKKIAEPSSTYEDEHGMPPPPETFPHDWEVEISPLASEVVAAAPVEPSETSPQEAPDAPPSDVPEPQPEPEPVVDVDEPVVSVAVQEPEVEPSALEPDVAAALSLPVEPEDSPQPQAAEVDNIVPAPVKPGSQLEPPKMVRVVLRSSGDRARDILRIRRIYGMLISYPGSDRFAFYVIENGRGYLMEFPNDTTGLNEELSARLSNIVGVENVQVEPITYL
jgi:hypothetical protein